MIIRDMKWPPVPGGPRRRATEPDVSRVHGGACPGREEESVIAPLRACGMPLRLLAVLSATGERLRSHMGRAQT